MAVFGKVNGLHLHVSDLSDFLSCRFCYAAAHSRDMLVHLNRCSCRYGHTDKSEQRIQEIDRELSALQAQSCSLGSQMSEDLTRKISALSCQDLRGSEAGFSAFPPLPGETVAAQKIDISNKKAKKENILQKQVRPDRLPTHFARSNS